MPYDPLRRPRRPGCPTAHEHCRCMSSDIDPEPAQHDHPPAPSQARKVRAFPQALLVASCETEHALSRPTARLRLRRRSPAPSAAVLGRPGVAGPARAYGRRQKATFAAPGAVRGGSNPAAVTSASQSASVTALPPTLWACQRPITPVAPSLEMPDSSRRAPGFSARWRLASPWMSAGRGMNGEMCASDAISVSLYSPLPAVAARRGQPARWPHGRATR